MKGKRILLCGFGHVGFRTFELLVRIGASVTIVTREGHPDWKTLAEELGATLILGDAREDRLLLNAGVTEAHAIIAATDQDMVNLSIAMDAKRLNPKIEVVLRIVDPRISHPLEKGLGLKAVLSPSALSAPVFASAALGESALAALTVNGRHFIVRNQNTPVDPHQGPLLAQVDGSSLLLQESVAHPSPLLPKRMLASVLETLKSAHRVLPFGIRFAIAALACVFIASVGIFHQALFLSVADSVYFTLTTITTVGFGDINLLHAPLWVKIYGCFLMLCGTALLATSFGVITHFLISARLKEIFGTRAIPTKDHTLLIGLESFVRPIAHELAQRHEPCLLLFWPPSAASSDRGIKRRDFAMVQGDPRNIETLESANINSAKAVLALTPDDLVNIGIALQGRAANPGLRTAVRTLDSRIGQKIDNRLGVDRVLSDSSVASACFAASVFDSKVVQATIWKGQLVWFTETADTPDHELLKECKSKWLWFAQDPLKPIQVFERKPAGEGQGGICLRMTTLPLNEADFESKEGRGP